MPTKTRIIRIGNSRGIRVPKVLLEQADLPEDVELRAEPGRLIVSASPARANWEDAARAMHEASDDELLDQPTPTRFDDEDWRW